MIMAFVKSDGGVAAQRLSPSDPLPREAVWIDLFEPTNEEEQSVERALELDVPTREEMQEIEISSRLYREGDALFLTATLLHKTETENPESAPVTFVLARDRLMTLRYVDPLPFRAFAAQLQRHHPSLAASGAAVLAGLLDAVLDRLADILERVQREVDGIRTEVFARGQGAPDVDFEDVLLRIGRNQGLTTRARESLVSIGRLLSFLTRPGEGVADAAVEGGIRTLSRDVGSLSDHATFLAGNINFLLDATLGMVNIEQNAIIKIFSVAAVVFLPPTLIASIYGMNFDFMPELGWPFGYPVAVGLMLLSAVLPYWYFKRRGWL